MRYRAALMFAPTPSRFCLPERVMHAEGPEPHGGVHVFGCVVRIGGNSDAHGCAHLSVRVRRHRVVHGQIAVIRVPHKERGRPGLIVRSGAKRVSEGCGSGTIAPETRRERADAMRRIMVLCFVGFWATSGGAAADVLVIRQGASGERKLRCIILDETETGYRVQLRIGGKVGKATYPKSRVLGVERQSEEENAALIRQWEGTEPEEETPVAQPEAIVPAPPAPPAGGGSGEPAAVQRLRAAAEQGSADAQYRLGEVYYDGRDTPLDVPEAAKWWRAAAKQGHANAQFQLGRLYAVGMRRHLVRTVHPSAGVQADPVEAVKWYRAAADQGHAGAQYELGKLYTEGSGVPQDEAEGLKWYQAAAAQGHRQAQEYLQAGDRVARIRQVAQQGNPEAQRALAQMYFTGEGVTRSEVEGVKWLRAAAAQGHFESVYAFSMMGSPWAETSDAALRAYLEGSEAYTASRYAKAFALWRPLADAGDANAQYGLAVLDAKVPEQQLSRDESRRWLRAAADQGHRDAQYLLGLLYQKGAEGVPRNRAEGRKWLDRAAAQGHREAEKTLDDPWEQLLEAAEQGDAASQYKLARWHNRGYYHDSRDMKAAVKWYRAAADQGHVEAQFHLGYLLHRGERGWLEADPAEAMVWYESAANQGHVAAAYELGRLYARGTRRTAARPGVRRDRAEARRWYQMAAERGHFKGQYALAELYTRGVGGPPDLVQAYAWFSVAAAQDTGGEFNVRAKRGKAHVKGQMTPQEIAEGDRLAAQWARAQASP